MHNHACMSACYSALADCMNSLSAKTEIEAKVRYSNSAETEIRPELEIWPVSALKPKPKTNFGRPLIYTYKYVRSCMHFFASCIHRSMCLRACAIRVVTYRSAIWRNQIFMPMNLYIFYVIIYLYTFKWILVITYLYICICVNMW